MNTTIRNLDETLYRRLKARAALEGRTIGDLFNDAIRAYFSRPDWTSRRSTLRSLEPEDYPEGNENLSKEIDRILYRREH